MTTPDTTAAEAPVRAQLATLGIEHQFIDCDPDLADTAQFCETYGYTPEESANTIIVASRTDPPQYVACVVLAHTRLDVNKAVRKRLGVRKCSFASADQTLELTGMLIGGVTAFGLPDDLPIWVDSRVMDQPRIVLGGGSRSCKLICEPAALLRLDQVEVVEDLALSAE